MIISYCVALKTQTYTRISQSRRQTGLNSCRSPEEGWFPKSLFKEKGMWPQRGVDKGEPLRDGAGATENPGQGFSPEDQDQDLASDPRGREVL